MSLVFVIKLICQVGKNIKNNYIVVSGRNLSVKILYMLKKNIWKSWFRKIISETLVVKKRSRIESFWQPFYPTFFFLFEVLF